MKKNIAFKTVIFDLDGTLLDTIEDIADSVNSVLTDMGLSGYSLNRYKYFVGQGMELLAHRILPERMRRKQTISAFVNRVKEEYGKRWARKTYPYKGISLVLEELFAKGIILNVLSNKPDEFVKPAVRHFFKEIKFVHILGSHPQRPNKPDPAGALQIASALSLSPEECVYVGDTHTDMETSTAAGMFAVGVLWGFRTEKELKDAGAARILHKPSELLKLFE